MPYSQAHGVLTSVSPTCGKCAAGVTGKGVGGRCATLCGCGCSSKQQAWDAAMHLRDRPASIWRHAHACVQPWELQTQQYRSDIPLDRVLCCM
jgi:hypothetical protein